MPREAHLLHQLIHQRDRARAQPSPRAVVYRMVTADHICPFGLKAKHALERRGYDVDDRPLRTREEAERFKRRHDVETTPQVFIEGERIGGFEALRTHFGLDEHEVLDGSTYQPVIATFATTLLMAAAASYATLGAVLTTRTVAWFVAFSMCVLAVYKLRNLESFTLQFLSYDLLARRFVPYAYVVPFVEGLAGVGMIAGVAVPWVAAGALFIGTVGAVSVVQAVYIERRELTCACVGGDSDVPLGVVSLTENLMMVGMALTMIVTYLLGAPVVGG